MDDHHLRRQRGERDCRSQADRRDKDVSIASASIAAQALDLGLVDEVSISLVPVLMSEGIPYFANLARAPHRFDDPVIIPGSRVTHLRYAVRRTGDRPSSPST
jgi:hypothetical protein